MRFVLEDLGVMAYGDVWLNWRHAVHPKTGDELALGSLARGGFMLINPRERSGVQVQPDPPLSLNAEGWAVGQAPDGSIYQARGFNTKEAPALLHWNWEGHVSTVVAEFPGVAVFTLDVAPDGLVYLPDYVSNRLYRFDPRSRKVEDLGGFSEFGDHIRNVCCAQDGFIYVTATNYNREQVVAIKPKTGQRSAIGDLTGGGINWQYSQILKDGAGRVLLCRMRWGQQTWHQLIEGRIEGIASADAQFARTVILSGTIGSSENMTPLAFRDGSYINRIEDTKFTVTDAKGVSAQFEVKREGRPLRIFSIASGGGKIWGGTFIPLTLFSFDAACGKSTQHGNPTQTNGEIYNMAFSNEKLYMASYTRAMLTRYTPGQPRRADNNVGANPAHLGMMKEEGLPLHRPHGCALDNKGNVFFAAHGDYGCEDSGLCRIDPKTEEVTRWIYPNTFFAALCYVPTTNQLLVSERRKGESGIHFSCLSPETGRIISSEIVIADAGDVFSWLPDGGDLIYGLHAWRATLFAYSLAQRKIVAEIRELRFGDHCHNALIFGPDDRIWGLTNQCVYAVTRDLGHAEKVADYEDHAERNFYRFGMCYGPDGAVYFPNGSHLMRVRS